MKHHNRKMNFDLHTIFYFFDKIWKYRKSFYLFYAFFMLVMIIKPLVGIFCPRMLIDTITSSGDMSRIIHIAAFMILATFFINLSVSITDEHLSKIYYEDLNRRNEADIGRKSMELKFIATEQKETLDYIHSAKSGISNDYSGGMRGLFKAFALLISNLVILIISASVVIRYSLPLLLVFVISVIINTAMNNRINAISLAQHEKLSSIDRGYYFLLHSLSDIRYGKDIRLFDAKEMMTHRVDSYNLEQSKITKDQAMQAQKFLYGSKLDMALTTILTYIILTIMAVKGLISLGEFTMLAASGAAIAASINMVLVQILDLQKFTRYAEKCVNFLENNDFEESGKLPCACDDSMEIEFKNVSFRYPGSEEYALRNINVKIRKGEHLSIVGLNGAGKTTFIKLLCRFYECTEGEITLNGINILEYDITSYRKLLAAVFQDFQLLGFSIKENIITGDPADVTDEKVNEIIKEVGLSEKVSSLSAGTDTCVFRYYDLNGFEPSGGEQQKLAMARALYKDAPVLILDEPTAALDPIAEKEVYEKFNEMTDGKTALFISHRLSSCKFCDSILVFKEGRIVERGTHSSLVSLPDGLYSQMFHAQAQYYA